MNTTMPKWLHRTASRLLLVTMVISAMGLTFARDILEDISIGPELIVLMASADQHDGPSQSSEVATEACDHRCHNTSHFLGQLPEDQSAALPAASARQFVPHVKRLAARDHTEPPFRPPRFTV